MILRRAGPRSARPIRRCDRAPIGRWQPRPIISPASRSWTSWPTPPDVDPLAFRLTHLANERLRTVLEKAAKEFGWADPDRRVPKRLPTSAWDFPAALKRAPAWRPAPRWRSTATIGEIQVRRVCQAFDCGAVVNPANLAPQNQGAIVMGLGGP